MIVEPWRRFVRNKKLASIGSRPGIGHRERAPLDLVLVELVLEGVPGATRSRPRRVAALDHEVRDDAVEDELVVETVARELDEVVDGLRRVLRVELDVDRPVVRVQGGVHRSVSASGSIALAVGKSSPDSSPRLMSRASCSASLS